MLDKKLRIGIVGLGNIAQKVYLPYLSTEKEWSLVGAYSTTARKRNEICKWYRIAAFTSLSDLIQETDAIFVHSSTASHFEIVSEALRKGKDVYVDKPLALNLEEAEKLVDLSRKTGRKLMVGFNRRFTPMYIRAKQEIGSLAWIRIEKHRINGISSMNFKDTILDDYIHLVDTARWLGEPVSPVHGWIEVNQEQQLIYAHHNYNSQKNVHISISMHRKAGTNFEQLELVGEGSIVRVKNMDIMETEREGKLITSSASAWETIIKRRGFEDAILHFINSVVGDTQPIVDGEEGYKTQKLTCSIIQQMNSIYPEG